MTNHHVFTTTIPEDNYSNHVLGCIQYELKMWISFTNLEKLEVFRGLQKYSETLEVKQFYLSKGSANDIVCFLVEYDRF